MGIGPNCGPCWKHWPFPRCSVLCSLRQCTLGLVSSFPDEHLYEPGGERPPVWLRGILILTCTGVSFAHGTNDGQKSIGLIMLTIIGLFPTLFALSPMAGQSMMEVPKRVETAAALIRGYGDDEKSQALDASKKLEASPAPIPQRGYHVPTLPIQASDVEGMGRFPSPCCARATKV